MAEQAFIALQSPPVSHIGPDSLRSKVAAGFARRSGYCGATTPYVDVVSK
ncbi:hypothetical protein OKW43_008224 [Paraburkholderia sp. WC7.3g]